MPFIFSPIPSSASAVMSIIEVSDLIAAMVKRSGDRRDIYRLSMVDSFFYERLIPVRAERVAFDWPSAPSLLLFFDKPKLTAVKACRTLTVSVELRPTQCADKT